MIDLGEISRTIASANAEMEAAASALSTDKEGRRGRLLAQAVDYFIDTKAEERHEAAERALDEARAASMAMVKLFLEAEVAKRIDEHEVDLLAWRESVKRTLSATEAFRKSELAGSLGAQALVALRAAADACSSAATMEMMDAVTSNKGIAIMSTAYTGTAKTEVNAAMERLAAFKSAVSAAREVTADFDVPDDMMDLAFDFALDLPFDIFSFLNMGKLNEAEEGCRSVAGKVADILPRLTAETDALRETTEVERAALQEIERPYLVAACEAVPSELAFALPRSEPTAPHGAGAVPGYGG